MAVLGQPRLRQGRRGRRVRAEGGVAADLPRLLRRAGRLRAPALGGCLPGGDLRTPGADRADHPARHPVFQRARSCWPSARRGPVAAWENSLPNEDPGGDAAGRRAVVLARGAAPPAGRHPLHRLEYPDRPRSEGDGRVGQLPARAAAALRSHRVDGGRGCGAADRQRPLLGSCPRPTRGPIRSTTSPPAV